MTSKDAKEFTDKVFDLIKKSKLTQNIDEIFETMKIPSKNWMKSDVYPQIQFKINNGDINLLIENGLIDKETLTFKNDVTNKLTDPLAKLLYATVWKNGDLKKIKHIIKGVIKVNDECNDQDDALVFYQFGKYLTKQPGQPIIDQHVIRAFAIYKSPNATNIEKLQKLETLNKKHKTLIDDYINWLKGDELSNDIKEISDYTYYIDKLLFATGKTIKFEKPKRKKNTVTNSSLAKSGVPS